MTKIEIPNDLHPTHEQIDNHLDKWTSIVQQAAESYVSKIDYRILPGIKLIKLQRKIHQIGLHTFHKNSLQLPIKQNSNYPNRKLYITNIHNQ